MRRGLVGVLLVAGAVLALVPFFALVGLGVHRHAAPWAISASAMLLVFVPPVGMAVVAKKERTLLLGSGLIAWALALFLVLPVYFPGERRQAVATGLAMTGLGSSMFGLPERLANSLPEEPTMATPEVAEAATLVVEPLPPATIQLSNDQIALPYEGEGRRLSVPIILSNQGTELEVDMMFDTGATYTTLPLSVLARLGVVPDAEDPVIRLHTANGERDAQVVLLDGLWLGDLETNGVAIATCDDCASDDTVGLLGLNVSGGFNVGIDADRREVVFTRRAVFDRKLDIKPFSDLSATFTRYPGGRVEVTVNLENRSRRDVIEATTSVRCGGGTWMVELGAIDSGDEGTRRRRLPNHDPCDQYEIALHEAFW